MSIQSGTKHVLIVEDQQLVRAGMRLLIHQANPECRITESGSYEEALEKIRATPFDFIFIDIDLRSEKSGYDLLEFLHDSGQPARAIMLSANDDKNIIMQCIAAGASGYISKSSDDTVVFRKAIETVMADGVFLPASVLGKGGYSMQLEEKQFIGRTGKELGLSERLCEVLFYLCQGMPNKTIAKKMGISEGTVRKNYVSELLSFFHVARRTELIIEVSRRQIRIARPRSAQDEAHR